MMMGEMTVLVEPPPAPPLDGWDEASGGSTFSNSPDPFSNSLDLASQLYKHTTNSEKPTH
jgi:hypothetical protein